MRYFNESILPENNAPRFNYPLMQNQFITVLHTMILRYGEINLDNYKLMSTEALAQSSKDLRTNYNALFPYFHISIPTIRGLRTYKYVAYENYYRILFKSEEERTEFKKILEDSTPGNLKWYPVDEYMQDQTYAIVGKMEQLKTLPVISSYCYVPTQTYTLMNAHSQMQSSSQNNVNNSNNNVDQPAQTLEMPALEDISDMPPLEDIPGRTTPSVMQIRVKQENELINASLPSQAQPIHSQTMAEPIHNVDYIKYRFNEMCRLMVARFGHIDEEGRYESTTLFGTKELALATKEFVNDDRVPAHYIKITLPQKDYTALIFKAIICQIDGENYFRLVHRKDSIDTFINFCNQNFGLNSSLYHLSTPNIRGLVEFVGKVKVLNDIQKSHVKFCEYMCASKVLECAYREISKITDPKLSSLEDFYKNVLTENIKGIVDLLKQAFNHTEILVKFEAIFKFIQSHASRVYSDNYYDADLKRFIKEDLLVINSIIQELLKSYIETLLDYHSGTDVLSRIPDGERSALDKSALTILTTTFLTDEINRLKSQELLAQLEREKERVKQLEAELNQSKRKLGDGYNHQPESRQEGGLFKKRI